MNQSDSPPAIDIPPMRHDPLRMSVLISGGGTTLGNFADKIAAGQLRAQIAVVICSNAKSQERAAAKNLGVPIHLVDRKDYQDPAAFSDVVFKLLDDADVDLVCLSGFLSLLVIPDSFVGRVLNIHPGLLPAFGGEGMYGHHVHEAVLAAKSKVSGCTVHFADQTYDTGPIILQRTCPVLDDDTPDTLQRRVFEQECEAYPEAINCICRWAGED
jgi:phosphoribosylglycinamide formyltransferase-1